MAKRNHLLARLRATYDSLVDVESEHLSNIDIGWFGGFEVAYRKGTVDEEVIKHSFDNDNKFTGVPEYSPDEDDIILDLGAHIGTFSLLAAARTPRGEVHAIEASRDSFNLLRINVALNRADNIHPHHLALADRRGTIELFHATQNWEDSVVKEHWEDSVVKRMSKSSETVPCETLADFLTEQRVERCAFVKINVEGAEFPILLGTSETVLRRFETMLVMYHCDMWKTNTEQSLIDHLQASGFRCEVRQQTHDRGRIIATQ